MLILNHVCLGDDPATLISVGEGWNTHLGILIDRLVGRKPRRFGKVHNRMGKKV